MAKLPSATIPEVDIIKAGIEVNDKYEDMRDESGFITITRSKSGQQAKEQAAAKLLAAEEEKLNKLKEKLSSMGVDTENVNKNVSTDDGKDIEKKIKKLKKLKKKGELSKKDKKKLKELENELAMRNKKDFNDDLLDSFGDDGIKNHILGLRGGKHKKHEPLLSGLSKKTRGNKADKQADPEKKEKPEKSEVKESFKEVEKLTKENIKEIDSTLDVVNKQIKDITSTSARIRGRETAISNFLQAKSTLINAKQSAIKDMASTTAKIYEIEMKKGKEKSEASNSHVEMLARVFPSIVADGNLAASISKDIRSSGKNKDSKKKRKGLVREKDNDMDEALMRRERKLIESGEIAYNDYDANIEYEGKFKVAIKKAFDGEWKFVATDKRDNFIDIPKKLLPKKSQVDMKFDDEKDTAVDRHTGQVYRVFSLPTI